MSMHWHLHNSKMGIPPQHAQTLPHLDQRLRTRYTRLVNSHMNATSKLSAGAKALLHESKAFAHTQAMWRFLHNPVSTAPSLAQPLLALAREEVPSACEEYALVMHDWFGLNFFRHTFPRRTKCR